MKELFIKDDPVLTCMALVFGLLLVLIVFICIAVPASIKQDNEYKDVCESKGGHYYKPYKSSPICLKSEDVIQ